MERPRKDGEARSELPRWRLVAAAIALCAITGLAYSPTLGAAFLSYDDVDYVVANPNLRDADGLARIWNPSEARYPLMYYPLTFTSYWIEQRLWGNEPRAHHGTNLALHLLNVVLVLLLIRRFSASDSVALIAAAIFALHPLQVASVAWIAERKNLLSTAFYLAAFLAYLRHRSARSGCWYAVSLVAFAAALLSKTQTLTFPLSLLLADLVLQKTRRLPPLRTQPLLWRLLPMVLLSVAAAAVTLAVEARADVPSFSLTTRVLIAANAAWFYVIKFFAPVDLSPIYPRWAITSADARWWAAIVAWIVALVAAVRYRRSITPLSVWGAAHFFIAVAPTLGLASWGFLEISFVADHFLYLSLLGGALALVAGVQRLSSASIQFRNAVTFVATLWLVSMTLQTHFEAWHWQNNLVFWRRVVERNPDGYAGNLGLGMQLDSQGEPERAVPYLRKAALARPRLARPFRRYVGAVAKARGSEAAVAACNERIARQPGFVVAYLERAIHEERLGRKEEARRDYGHVQQTVPKGSALWREATERMARLDS